MKEFAKKMTNSLFEIKNGIKEAKNEQKKQDEKKQFLLEVQSFDNEVMQAIYEVCSEYLNTKIFLKDDNGNVVEKRGFLHGKIGLSLGWNNRWYRYNTVEKIDSNDIAKIKRKWKYFCESKSNKFFTGLIYQFEWKDGDLALVFITVESDKAESVKRAIIDKMTKHEVARF